MQALPASRLSVGSPVQLSDHAQREGDRRRGVVTRLEAREIEDLSIRVRGREARERLADSNVRRLSRLARQAHEHEVGCTDEQDYAGDAAG